MIKDVIIRGRMFGEPSELNLTRLAKDKDSLFHQLLVKAIKKERNKRNNNNEKL